MRNDINNLPILKEIEQNLFRNFKACIKISLFLFWKKSRYGLEIIVILVALKAEKCRNAYWARCSVPLRLKDENTSTGEGATVSHGQTIICQLTQAIRGVLS